MAKVVQLSSAVSVSEKGKALCALEAERAALYERSRRITAEQQQVLKLAHDTVAHLSREQEQLLLKMAALDEAADKLIHV